MKKQADIQKRAEGRARRVAGRKAYFLLVLLLLLMAAAGRSMAGVSGNAAYVAAAGQQSIYQLDVAKSRGTIYDCKLRPLTGTSSRWVAAVAPTIEAIGALETATGGRYRERLAVALEDGKPFAMELERTVEHACVDMFRVPKRYEEDQLAPHVVGYLDGQGKGAAGVELAMDDALDRHKGAVSVFYQVDALGRVIAGAQRMVSDTMEATENGVAVTIDSELQRMAEKAAARLGRGAVVITEVPGCQIRALASMPDFAPTQIAKAAQSQDAPLVNRAFSAYAPGSVFKLVTAAAELESGGALGEFTCTGALNAGGLLFNCYDGEPHGKVDLQGAIAQSCNCYFISAARAMGGQPVLEMAYNLGLGAGQEFGRGLYAGAGALPAGESLANARALANFSFGQGALTVTPVQMCGLLNAIAAGGVYNSPKLIEGLVDGAGNLEPQQAVTDISRQAMSGTAARRLQDYLVQAAKEGTGAGGNPENCVCGIKTGTAQTGVYADGEECAHFWYCGFVGDGSGPKYCITVLRESVVQDGGVTAGVFREIAGKLGEMLAEGA